MAEMTMIAIDDKHQFGCYGERGLMSYFMFVQLPKKLPEFLKSLRFPNEASKPFANLNESIQRSIIFSELSFGNEGFGSPDGAIYVQWPEPMMIFLEVKANESYVASCNRTYSYNSTIRGQLELRWRMTELHRSNCHQTYNGDTYLQETMEFKNVYQDRDKAFYGHMDRDDPSWPGSWRRLKIVEGVKDFLDLLSKCEDRVYFCAITNEGVDPKNPFDSIGDDHRPRCGALDWKTAMHQFCWLPIDELQKGLADV